jgi:replicative DNA helicase
MELLTLHALRDKQKYKMLRGAVPTEMLGGEAVMVLNWYQQYFNAFPDETAVDVQGLISLIKLRSGYDANTMAMVMHIIGKLEAPYNQALIDGVVNQLIELDFSGKVAQLVSAYQNNEEVGDGLAYEVARLAQQSLREQGVSAPTDYITEDVMTILDDEAGDHGIKLPTTALKLYVKGLLGGASILVAAPPDAGKTSLLACIAAEAAPQIPTYFREDRPILWLNNEGKGRRIIPRLYQAVLKVDLDTLHKMGNAGTLHDAYTKAIGGRADRIRIKDFHGGSLAQAEQIIEQMKPCMVIWDMPANIKFKGSGQGGNKTDILEEKWQEIREMACRHDFISVGTCQISVEGRNNLHPPQEALKDSKTAIQGAVDVQIHLGAMTGAGYQDLRGISTPKNKYQMPGMSSNFEATVGFNAAQCQFVDGEVAHA